MIPLFAFIIGAVVGSFLNVCIYRIPRKESIVFPRSRCPKCRHAIAWYDNIPILSYALLAGKCGYCRAKIPLHYIVVEITTALLFLGLAVAYGMTGLFFAYAVMASGLVVITFIDLATYEIPDRFTLGGIAVGVAMSFAFPALHNAAARGESILASIAGVLAGGGSIYLMGVVGKLLTKKEAMGGGDVKLMAAVGAFLGWKLTMLAFFIAPFFGALVGIILKAREGKTMIPYGPFLSLGALIALFFGDKIMRYLFGGF